MKKLALISFLLMSFFPLCQGIQFEEGNFASVLAKAKKENKLVFIDAYTTWCAPCKLMAKNIFPLKSVGDYYNSNFVNTKIDMEKGEGKELAKKFGVVSFDTYLILNGDGELVHRSGSSLSEQEFLQLAKDAQDPKRQLPLIKKKFEKGESDPEFLKTAASSFLRTGDTNLAEQALDKYFKQKQTNDLTEDEFDMIRNLIYQNPTGKYYTFFKDRKNDIVKVISPESYEFYDYNFKLKAVTGKSIDKKTKKFNETIFLAEAEKAFGKEKAPQVLLKEKTYMALGKKDFATYEKLTLDLYKDYTSLASGELNSAAWSFFENVNTKSSLETAVLWAQESIKKNQNTDNTDTLANLYNKLGDKIKAKEWAQKSIELSKAAGKDSSGTQKLLDSL